MFSTFSPRQTAPNPARRHSILTLWDILNPTAKLGSPAKKSRSARKRAASASIVESAAAAHEASEQSQTVETVYLEERNLLSDFEDTDSDSDSDEASFQ